MNQKYEKLTEQLREMGTVMIAFSGGVDSTFLLITAVKTLGASHVYPVTAVSEFLKEGELQEAETYAENLGVNVKTVRLSVLNDAAIAANPAERCYYCKKKIFGAFIELAAQKNIPHILEGSNLDDLTDFRPGMKAIKELGIESPLLSAGLTKAEIRHFLRQEGHPTAEKPSAACLASRIPYDTTITKETLNRVEQAEAILLSLGFNDIRVRDHGAVSRIETNKDQISKLIEAISSAAVIKSLKNLGYVYITVDIEGYRTGSLNEKVLTDG